MPAAAPPYTQSDGVSEDLAARLTLTAYDVALRQGFRGRFTDLQAALWGEFVGLVRDTGLGGPIPAAKSLRREK